MYRSVCAFPFLSRDFAELDGHGTFRLRPETKSEPTDMSIPTGTYRTPMSGIGTNRTSGSRR
jgi:hypothetical protein